jgi:hypothetical protein
MPFSTFKGPIILATSVLQEKGKNNHVQSLLCFVFDRPLNNVILKFKILSLATWLTYIILGRLSSEGLWFEASPDKKLLDPHLKQ